MHIFPLTECAHDHFNEQKQKQKGGDQKPAQGPGSRSTRAGRTQHCARSLSTFRTDTAVPSAPFGSTSTRSRQSCGWADKGRGPAGGQAGGRRCWKQCTSEPTSSSLLFICWTRRTHSAAALKFVLQKPLGSPVTSAGPAGSHTTSSAAGGVGATVNSGPAQAHRNPFPCPRQQGHHPQVLGHRQERLTSKSSQKVPLKTTVSEWGLHGQAAGSQAKGTRLCLWSSWSFLQEPGVSSSA